MPLATCHLCKRPDVELRDSHLLPRWAYQLLHDHTTKASSPVSVRGNTASKFPKQLHEHHLCETCEQRLSAHENVVRGLVYQPSGIVPLLKALSPLDASQLLIAEAEFPWFSLVYFSASIIWRGHSMACGDVALTDETAEDLRRFLISGELPPATIRFTLRIMRPDPDFGRVDWVLIPPASDVQPGVSLHQFLLAGFEFGIWEGPMIPELCDYMCLVNCPVKLVDLCDNTSPTMLQRFRESLPSVRGTGSLAPKTTSTNP